jgi:hypothetical protein
VSKEVVNMRISVLPKTSFGRWSVGLVAACILLLVLLWLLGAFLGVYAGEGGRFQLVALILGVAIGVSGVGSFVAGLISIIRSKERSILVFLVVIIVFFVLLMEFLEFLLPH